jgi:hypothetical protein
MKKLLISFLIADVLLCAPLSVIAQTVMPEFNPNIIIPDTAFGDTKTFGGPEGIQRFLESKGSVLANTSPDFLTKLSEPNDPALKAKLDDPNPNLGRLRTAAEIIWDASQASGINPQVLLVTLNKEQSLITGNHSPERLQRALNHAMGFDCPDATGCGNLFPGFYYQLMGNVDLEGNRYLGAAKSLMKSFSTPSGRGPMIGGSISKVGDTVEIENTLGDFAGILGRQLVTIGNRATAALYRYTPHVFNGNYNFWRFFTAWFRYPNGTVITSPADGLAYIIQNGERQRVLPFVATVRNLNLTNAIAVSPTELENYPLGSIYGPPDSTIISLNDTLFVFMNGVRHPVSSFVLTQRKLDPTKKLPISTEDATIFTVGSQLTPTDGTVLRGQQDTTAYLVSDGVLKKYSEFTFTQHKAAKLLQTIPDSEIAIYPKQGFVAPLDGTLIQNHAKTNTYLMNKERRLPLTPELMKNLGFRTKDVVTLTTDEEIASIPIGPPATPKENTYFTYGGAHELFLFKDGAKHPISPFVAKQRFITPDFTFEASIASSWPEGIAIPPKNGTLIKSDKATTVYIVTAGQLRPITGEVFKNLKLSFKNVNTMPDADLQTLAKGGFATPAENTYFTTSKNFYVYRKGVKQLITPFVAKQRGMTPDFSFTSEAASDWADGTPIPPREGTLLQGDGTSTVYIVEKTILRSLTDTAFKRRGFSRKNVKVIPVAELNLFPRGTAIVK